VRRAWPFSGIRQGAKAVSAPKYQLGDFEKEVPSRQGAAELARCAD
jgi:hypothetical protein